MGRDPKQILKDAKRVRDHATSNDMRGAAGADAYIPYETSSQAVERLRILRHDDTCHAPSYRYLLDVVHLYDGDGVILVYSFIMVKVKGKNLEGLIEHLIDGDVTLIQKFDADFWVRPPVDQPIIDSIDVVVRTDGDEPLLEKSGKRQPARSDEWH